MRLAKALLRIRSGSSRNLCCSTRAWHNKAWPEEVKKERSEIKCLCAGTGPPNKKWGLNKSGGAEKPIQALSLENFSLVAKKWREAEAPSGAVLVIDKYM